MIPIALLATITIEPVEKLRLIFLASFSGVSLPYPSKRSSIVDRIMKPLFLASHKEIYSEAFSTVSIVYFSLSGSPKRQIGIRNLEQVLSGHGEFCRGFVGEYRTTPQATRDVVMRLQGNIKKTVGFSFSLLTQLIWALSPTA